MKMFSPIAFALILISIPGIAHAKEIQNPAKPPGDTPLLPLAGILSSQSDTCPTGTLSCPSYSVNHQSLSTNLTSLFYKSCCPKGTTCIARRSESESSFDGGIVSEVGIGCCGDSPCPNYVSREKCAVPGWVVCGLITGPTKDGSPTNGSTICCEKAKYCKVEDELQGVNGPVKRWICTADDPGAAGKSSSTNTTISNSASPTDSTVSTKVAVSTSNTTSLPPAQTGAAATIRTVLGSWGTLSGLLLVVGAGWMFA